MVGGGEGERNGGEEEICTSPHRFEKADVLKNFLGGKSLIVKSR